MSQVAEPTIRSPRIGVLFLTPACNMTCGFCGSDEGFEPLDPEAATEWLVQFKSQGGESVVMGGGEPLLWPHDLAALAARAHELGLFTQIGSNATLAAQRSDLLRAFDRWVLPLESDRPQRHDRMRRYHQGHFKLVVEHLERLRLAKVEVSVSSVVSAQNFDELLGLGQRLRAYAQAGGHLHAWHLYRFLPLGRSGARNAKTYEIDLTVFHELGRLLKANFKEIRVLLRPDMYHSQEVGFFWKSGLGWQAQLPDAENRLH